MGVDLIVQCFRDGECTTFSPQQIGRSFAPYAKFCEPDGWLLNYPDGGVCEIDLYITEKGLEGFMIQRPPASPELWRSLLDFMQQTPSALFITSGGLFIANPTMRDHIPSGVIEQSGSPIFISTPEELRRN